MTFFYTALMFCLFITIMSLAHRSMEWAVTSELVHEMLEAAVDVASTESLLMENGVELEEDLGERDRIFFYVYNSSGEIKSYSRASSDVENDVLEVIHSQYIPEDDVAVFEKTGKKGREAVLMLTQKPILINDEIVGTAFVGRDITSLYKGIRKSTYVLGGLSLIALLIAAWLGHKMSGRVILPMQQACERERQFAADASHELRTPLAVVLASAEVLESDKGITSPVSRQVIEDLKSEVHKMTKLVGDLLTVARNEAGAESLLITEFDIGAQICQVARNMRQLAQKKDILISCTADEGIMFSGDEQRIGQLVLILVDNAVKYTPSMGQVTIQLEKYNNGDVSFSVADTGVGIAPEDKDKIFDRFYRVDKARSREMGGNGLGLSIANCIVKAHAGKITVESRPGEGTVFKVYLRSQKQRKQLRKI